MHLISTDFNYFKLNKYADIFIEFKIFVVLFSMFLADKNSLK